MTFDELIGKQFDFYGAAEHKFRLDDTTWEAVEDESDGYRSCLGSVEAKEPAILFNQPIARVRLAQTADKDFYTLTDMVDHHVWLRFGTDNSDNYYPWFVFDYQPKEPK